MKKELLLYWRGLQFNLYINKALKKIRAGNYTYEPWMLYLQTHNRCNGGCVICPYPSIIKNQEYKEIEWSFFKAIVKEYSSTSLPRFIVFGLHSEPLLDGRIFDFINYIKSQRKDIFTMMFTNASLLSKKTALNLIKSGLDYIKINLISLDKDTYGILNPELDYTQILKNTKEFIKLANGKIVIRICLAQTSPDKNYCLNLKKAKRLGVKIEMNILSNRCGSIDNYEDLYARHRYQVREENFLHNRIFRGCWFPFYVANISCEGNILLCCNDWKQKLILGNLNMQNLNSVWNGQEISSIRRDIIRSNYNDIPLCRECYLVKKKIIK